MYAQSTTKLLQKADSQYEAFSYAKAIDLFETALRKGKNLTPEEILKIKLKLAWSYRQVKDNLNAERLYQDALSKNPILKGEDIKAYQYYAQVLASNGKHSLAKHYYQKFTALQEQDKRGIEFAKLYSNVEALSRNAGSYKVEYVGINTSSADFSPVYYKNGLVFVSGRSKFSGIKRVFSWDNSSFLDLFYLEDIKALGTESTTSAIGSSAQSNPVKPAPPSKKLGSDYYTPPTANDAETIGHKGSDYISGSKEYEENAAIPTKKFSRSINSKYHEGPCTFFHDGSKIVFTRNNLSSGGILGLKKDDVSRLKLYIADNARGDWQNIREVPFNGETYNCGHPTLTVDDKIMYFVSDMPGGYGGTDIYMTHYNNGIWTKPVNLGGLVNTQGNEMFPYIDERGNLYFSSDGHPGLGDLDIFFIPMNTATGMPTGKVRNLGAPLNSTRDDFGIITDSERKYGYFSSNRKRGGTDDDIYKFSRIGTLYGCREVVVNIYDNETKRPFDRIRFEYQVKGDTTTRESAITNNLGTIKLCLDADQEYKFSFTQNGYKSQSIAFDNYNASDYEPSKMDIYLKRDVVLVESKSKNKTKNNSAVKKTASSTEPQTLSQRRVKSSGSTLFRGLITAGKDSTPIAGVRVRFINHCDDTVQEMITQADGSYEFKRNSKCEYTLEVSKEGFGFSTETIEKLEESPIVAIFKKKKKVVPTAAGSFFDTKLYRVGDVVKLDNIYYDQDSWKIRHDATRELNKLVATMKKYPNMIIEIRSHTDTRGNSLDNKILSEKRAKEVLEYLARNGVSRERMRAVGKGESEPVNECGDGVQCTEAEHQRNRRTEFKILKIERI